MVVEQIQSQLQKKLESSSSAVLLSQAGKCTNTRTLKIVDGTSVAFS